MSDGVAGSILAHRAPGHAHAHLPMITAAPELRAVEQRNLEKRTTVYTEVEAETRKDFIGWITINSTGRCSYPTSFFSFFFWGLARLMGRVFWK